MNLIRRFLTVAAGLALAAPVTRGDDLPRPIDLTSFGRVEHADAAEIVPVADSFDPPATRLYVSGIVGASFATINTGGSRNFAGSDTGQTGAVNETIFTGGGAIGTAFTRSSGLLRMEVEGRARGPMSGPSDLTVAGVPVTTLDVQATDSWSAMANFWRDFFVTDTVGLYAGGGFGAGGYQYSLATPDPAEFLPLSGSSTNTTFAWQVGAGVVYEINERMTLDTSYRFFAMSPESTTVYIANSSGLGSYTSAFSASELLLSLRIYEPFRRWR